MMVAGLLIVGASACGSSGGDKKSDTPSSTDSSGGGGGGGSASSNSKVKAYCDAVDAYIQKYKDANGDTSKLASLSKDSQDLAAKAQALATAGLSSSDAQDVAACTKKSTDAIKPAG
jgi:hypothetical protein